MTSLSVQDSRGNRQHLLFAVVVTAVYALITAVFMARHVMWRDEWHMWLIARDATDLSSLWEYTRPTGHPGLWYLLLFVVSRLFRDPAVMQVLHFVVATAAVFIFLYFARLPRLHKLLYAFGFFPMYQYAIISRCYAPGLLLMMGYCALVTTGRHGGLPGAVVLALLANASAFGWLLAVALGVVFLLPESFRAPRLPNKILPGFVFACGLIVSLIVMFPSADATCGGIQRGLLSGNVPWLWSKAAGVLRCVGDTYLSGMIQMLVGEAAAVSLACIFFFALAFLRQRSALAFYLISLFGMLVFKYLVYLGYYWHDGHFLIALVASCWLYFCLPQRALKWPWLDAASRACSALLPGVLAVFLALHVIFAGFNFLSEWKRPYSGSKAAADFIANSEFRGAEIIGDVDYTLIGVSGYLDRPIYYLASESWGTFVLFNNKRHATRGDPEEMRRRIGRLGEWDKDRVLVLNYELTPSAADVLGARFLYASPQVIFGDERFWVYHLPPQGAEREKRPRLFRHTGEKT